MAEVCPSCEHDSSDDRDTCHGHVHTHKHDDLGSKIGSIITQIFITVFGLALTGFGTLLWAMNDRQSTLEKNQIEIREKMQTLEKQFETQRQDDRLRHEQLSSSLEKRIDKLEYKLDKIISGRGIGAPGLGAPSE